MAENSHYDLMKKIDCPRCGKNCEYSPNNPYRPFCSHRCQLLDLGEWADEKYTIPSSEPATVGDREGGSKNTSSEKAYN